jgi:hypothetical protein
LGHSTRSSSSRQKGEEGRSPLDTMASHRRALPTGVSRRHGGVLEKICWYRVDVAGAMVIVEAQRLAVVVAGNMAMVRGHVSQRNWLSQVDIQPPLRRFAGPDSSLSPKLLLPAMYLL